MSNKLALATIPLVLIAVLVIPTSAEFKPDNALYLKRTPENVEQRKQLPTGNCSCVDFKCSW